MSSSEEYLDNLLKAITEGNAYEGPSPSMAEDMAGAEEEQGVSATEEPDTTMSMDDIEAVFASMGAETVEEETQEAMPSGEGMPLDELVLDDSMLSDELPIDEGMMSDELALDEGILSDGLALNEESVSDELVLDDSLLSDELMLDDSMLSDELPIDEEMMSDELALDEGILSDGLALNEEPVLDELVLDDSLLSDELVLDDSMMSDELVLDEGMLADELALNEESVTDELILDEGMMSDELASDDNMLSDESTPDGGAITEDFTMDEAMPDELTLEESMEDNAASDDLSLDELGLGDLGLEDLGLEEAEQDGAVAGDDFALEAEPEAGEAFALESGDEVGDNFALEETGEEDADLSALLASMGGDDDLSEINDLLEKSDQGVAIDDDVMAMLDGVSDGEESGNSFDFFSGDEAIEGDQEDIREITPEELAERENPRSKKQKKKEEKEKKKRAKKAKKESASQDENAGEESADDLNGLLEGTGENGEEPKKKGAFARFLDFLLEEDEEEGEGDSEDVGVVIGNLSEENKELLAELKAEDKKNAKKKNKKDKTAKKGKKGKAGADGGDDEEEAAPKPKKPKKEKKKKEKIEEEPQVPEKKLSRKKVVSVFLFCATIAACIVVVTILLPEQLEKQEARVAFDQSQYTQVYELLYGKELSEEDEVLLHKSSTILKLQRKLDSYENYVKMDMPLEALNALLEGVSRYQNLRDDAELYNVSGEVTGIYGQILDALANNYGLSEADALDIIASEDDVTYSQRVQAVISGEAFGMEEEAVPEGKQDVLPEEEEIIDRLEGAETE